MLIELTAEDVAFLEEESRHHHVQEAYADGVGDVPECVKYHEHRRKGFDRILSYSTSPAINAINYERERQQTEEGWTRDHDDHHASGHMANAAAYYALTPDLRNGSVIAQPLNHIWPWDWAWFKPKHDRRQQLVIAGALIVAEIERLDRAAA